ncbi:unnamed protein product [Chrysoparadoxa australica]
MMWDTSLPLPAGEEEPSVAALPVPSPTGMVLVVMIGNGLRVLKAATGAALWSWEAEGANAGVVLTGLAAQADGSVLVGGYNIKSGKIDALAKLRLDAPGQPNASVSVQLAKVGRASVVPESVGLVTAAGNLEQVAVMAQAKGSNSLLVLGADSDSVAEVSLDGILEGDVTSVQVVAGGSRTLLSINESAAVTLSSTDGSWEAASVCSGKAGAAASGAGLVTACGPQDGGKLTLQQPGSPEAVFPNLGSSSAVKALYPHGSGGVLVVHEGCEIAMLSKDEQGAGELWSRDEALSRVESVDFVDQATDELSALGQHQLPSFTERLELQFLDLQAMLAGKLSSLLGGESVPTAHVRDEFGLKKLALVKTGSPSNKIMALNSGSGEIVWSHKLPEGGMGSTKLFVTRAKAVLGYLQEFALIGKNSITWHNALTGEQTSSMSTPTITSAMPLDLLDEEDRQLLMLDTSEGIQIAPSSPGALEAFTSMLPDVFHHTIGTDESGATVLTCYTVIPSDTPGSFSSAPVASVVLASPEDRLVATASTDRREVIASPAHVLGDDSLLLKYLNPHMLAAFTASPSAEGSKITCTLVDLVSGRVLHQVTHEHATEPVHAVVFENNVVYSFWNHKSGRTEMSSLSLYEGMVAKYGLNPFNKPTWSPKFSSFESQPPITLQKTYVFPHAIRALSTTLTRRGIASKHVLVALEHGQLLSLDFRYLDPRRPTLPPNKAQKEEKLLQYQPFLPVNRAQIVSYYKVIERLSDMRTVATGLESTSLVLATGLDLFCQRLAPNKKFDVLATNFSYFMLMAILAAMVAAMVVVKKMAYSKRLRTQWA